MLKIIEPSNMATATRLAFALMLGRENGQPPTPKMGKEEAKFYMQTHKFYCGIDVHARTMYLCVNWSGER
jgi:hypothetical protein